MFGSDTRIRVGESCTTVAAKKEQRNKEVKFTCIHKFATLDGKNFSKKRNLPFHFL